MLLPDWRNVSESIPFSFKYSGERTFTCIPPPSTEQQRLNYVQQNGTGSGLTRRWRERMHPKGDGKTRKNPVKPRYTNDNLISTARQWRLELGKKVKRLKVHDKPSVDIHQWLSANIWKKYTQGTSLIPAKSNQTKDFYGDVIFERAVSITVCREKEEERKKNSSGTYRSLL